MTFQFDTSGEVIGVPPNSPDWPTVWTDLSPFVQGYVEALPWQALDLEWAARCIEQPERHFRHIAFSDLAPETLVRIMADCERLQERYPGGDPREESATAWKLRQRGELGFIGFPPLTPYLGDDGKVYLKEKE